MASGKRIEKIYPLSPMQGGMLFHSLMSKTSSNYFVQDVLNINGQIDKDLLEESFRLLVERYDVLRTVFRFEKLKEPLQVVLKQRAFNIHFEDISHLEKMETNAYLETFTREDKARGFDLDKDFLMRVSMFKRGSSAHTLVWSFHHILMDGWCFGIIYEELCRFYRWLKDGKQGNMELPVVIPYADYINWLQKQDKNAAIAYWRKYLENYEDKAGLPPSIRSKDPDQYKLAEYSLLIDKEQASLLNKITAGGQVTLNTVFQALWAILLQLYNNTDDVVFGAVVSGRPPEIMGIERMVGLFINTIPVRIRMAGKEKQPFGSLLQKIQENSALSKRYEYLPLAEIQSNSLLKGNLIDHIVAVENFPIRTQLTSAPIESGTGFYVEDMDVYEQTNYNLNIIITPLEQQVEVKFNYNALVYDAHFLERVACQLDHVINQVLDNPGILINKIEIVTGKEKEQVLFDFNNTSTVYPAGKTVHRMFEEQVERRPDCVAVSGQTNSILPHVLPHIQLTYRELNAECNRLAYLLRERCAVPGTVVAILGGRSVAMVVGIMAILKAGGAYLPIAPEYPEERVRWMLEDSRASILLLEPGLTMKSEFNREVIHMECPCLPGRPAQEDGKADQIPGTRDLAYVLYTSGSTGTPKGVMVEQRSIIRLVINSNFITLSENTRILQTAAPVFDVSTFEVWGTLLNGGRLSLVHKDVIVDAQRLSRAIQRDDINILWLSSPLFNQLVRENGYIFSGLEYLMVGGDALVPRYINSVRAKCEKLKIINGYGPTENTAFSTTFSIENDYRENIPIGAPIANSTAYILDRNNRLLPVGIPGELCVGGDGVSRGYLNRPELTAEKFIIDQSPVTNDRLYKTGDLARWLPDGTIEFLGRIDRQVKIRGFRVELGEIENHLLTHDKIKAAIVVIKDDKMDHQFLCVYFIPDGPSSQLTSADLRQYLQERLPDYMVPSYFVPLNEFPLTPGGKLNLGALPEPVGIDLASGAKRTKPRNPVEEKLVEIYQELLGRENIGINDNFFEMGGDSIKSIQLASRLSSTGYKVKMRDIFKNPTISQLAFHAKLNQRKSEQSTITGNVPLTPIQRWFFDGNPGKKKQHFNQAVMFHSPGRLEESLVKAIFTKIHEHHDALRITVNEEKGDILQTIRGLDLSLAFQVFDLQDKEPAHAAQTMETRSNEIQAGIDLQAGPLMQVVLFHMPDKDYLLIVIHHLVIDTVSWRILFEDIGHLHNQYIKGEPLVLPEKTDSLKLWSQRLSQYAHSETLLEEKNYWRQLESQAITPIAKDFEIEDNRLKDIKIVSISLEEEETDRLLTRVNEPFGTEINDILLTALGLAIRETFGSLQVAISLEGHGREDLFEDIDISRTVGWFTCMFPVLLEISHENNLGRQLKEIKETMRRVPDKGIGYGILKYLTHGKHKEGLEFRLTPQISFNYLGNFDTDLEQISFGTPKEPIGSACDPNLKRAHEIDVSGMVVDNRLQMELMYNKMQYKAETMETLLNHFQAQLKRIISYCLTRKNRELTPSDLTYKNFSIEALEQLESRYPLQDIYTLAPLQNGMMFHALHDKDINPTTYFEQLSYRLNGPLNVGFVEKSLNQLFKRHDILRAVFIYEGFEHPLQLILKNRRVDFVYKDIRAMTSARPKETVVREFRESDRSRAFDLGKDVLMRVTIIQVEESTYEFIWSFHHILMDGWCLGILISEYVEIYNSYLENRAWQLPETIPYRRFIQWLEKQDQDESGKYWAGYLDNYSRLASLPRLKASQNGSGEYKNADLSLSLLDTEETLRLEQLAAKNRMTINTVLQSAWGILLGKYNGTGDVVFATVVSGRPSDIDGVESIVGLFINAVPIRIRFNGKTKISDLFRRVQEEALESEPHHYYPLAKTQSESLLKQNILDHIFAFENFPVDKIVETQNEFVITDSKVFEQSNYNFNVGVVPGERLSLTVRFNENAFEKNFVGKIIHHFNWLLRRLLENHDMYVADMSILPPMEKEEILYAFNRDAEAGVGEKTLHGLFEEQVENYPARIAVSLGENKLTYAALNKKSNQLANLLREKGVKPGDIIGILMDRSPGMMAAILGILKAGGAYLPINVDYPENRIASMLKDCRSPFLLTKKGMIIEYSFSGLQGLSESRCKLFKSSPRPPVSDFDALPMVDRSLVDYEKYNTNIGHGMVTNSITIQATRGCPYDCAFCCRVWPRKYTFRSAENIFAEVRHYYRMGVRRFVFIDDIFNLSVENSSRFFNLVIDSGLKIQILFPSGLRGDILTEDYIDLMVAAGVISFPLSLETASPRLQKKLRKNLDLQRFARIITYITEKHPQIILELNSMHGFPSETEEEAMMTLNFIKSVKYFHFPYVHLLRIYPNTDMLNLALENGVPREAITKSMRLAYHELPETLPFSKDFTLKYQAEFLNQYFLLKERLLHVLPHQMKVLTENEIIQKYNSYISVEIKSFAELLGFLNITPEELGSTECLKESEVVVPGFNEKLKDNSPIQTPSSSALRVLLMDLSQFISDDVKGFYDLSEPPLGLMYLMSYLCQKFGDKIAGKIVKSRSDFDSYAGLKALLEDFKPDVIGIRTLSYFKDFFHKAAAVIRQWGFDGPIIAGGPYATTEYPDVLNDRNVDLVVLGEGELTLGQLIEEIIAHGGKLPGQEILEQIPGIVFAPQKDSDGHLKRQILFYDELSSRLSAQPDSNPLALGGPHSPAYVMYTSGSTGMPKGVMTSHANAVRVVKDTNYIPISAGDRLLQLSDYAFDGSTFDIYGALVNGASLVMLNRQDLMDLDRLLRIITGESITIFFVTTALFNALVDLGLRSLRNVKKILFGGEKVSVDHARRALEYLGKDRVIHVYGPTETTVYAAYHFIDRVTPAMDTIPIGKPLSNTSLYVLDRGLDPVPIGVNGELYIGAGGVARGYVNRPLLTRERFIPNPFVQGDILYKTGDLVRRLPGGDIEFIGRIDHQVKIRGFRIEPGEIKNCLNRHDKIKEAVVVTKEDENRNKYLCAYIVTAGELTQSEIRDYLGEDLPVFMIPTYIVFLDKFTLNANGKIDYKALPEPTGIGPSDDSGHVKPRNTIEQQMVEIWTEVLGRDTHGIKENFFEIGGDSIKAMTLASHIHTRMDVRVPMNVFFSTPTIEALGLYIENTRKEEFSHIEPVEKADYYELSHAQKRLWISDQLEKGHSSYNIYGALVLEGLDTGLFKQAFYKLLKRHEVLLTTFILVEEEPKQKINDFETLGIQMEDIDLTREEDPMASAERIVSGEAVKPFHLENEPLVRAKLLHMADNSHVFVYAMHHIIADAWAMGIVVDELFALYNGCCEGNENPLSPLRIQYKDFAAWENRQLQGGAMDTHRDYWLNRFGAPLPVLELKTDYPRPALREYNGDHVTFQLNKKITTGLTRIGQQQEASLYMVLLTALKILLSRYTGQTDIIIGCPTAGRDHKDLENQIGYYLHTLVFRTTFSMEDTFESLLNKVRKTVLEAFEHQSYPFDTLIGQLKLERDSSRSPLFDVVAQLVDLEMGSRQRVPMKDVEMRTFETGIFRSKFDFTFNFYKKQDTTEAVFIYCTDLFERRTVERICSRFQTLLQHILETPQKRISDLKIQEKVSIPISNRRSIRKNIQLVAR